jgi:hypothetical protein
MSLLMEIFKPFHPTELIAFVLCPTNFRYRQQELAILFEMMALCVCATHYRYWEHGS